MKNFSEMLEIYSFHAAASNHEIKELKQRFKAVPEDYLNIAKTKTEIEFKVKPDGYLRIWCPSGCIEMFDAYNFEKYIPEGFPFGDNGGDKAFLFMRGLGGKFGVYMIPYGDIDREGAIFVTHTINDMLYKGAGLNVVLSNI